jgi:hypothetical protein
MAPVHGTRAGQAGGCAPERHTNAQRFIVNGIAAEARQVEVIYGEWRCSLAPLAGRSRSYSVPWMIASSSVSDNASSSRGPVLNVTRL